MDYDDYLAGSDDPELFAMVRASLIYDWRRGLFIWKVKQGSQRAGNLAGSVATRKFKREQYARLKFHGKEFVSGVLAWFYVTGKMPAKIYFKDGDGLNVAWSNLTTNSPLKSKRIKQERFGG